MRNYLYLITSIFIIIAAVQLLLLIGCALPKPKDTIMCEYDSVQNRTILRSQPERIGSYFVLWGYTPDLSMQAYYECPGIDTACVPKLLRINWTLKNSRESKKYKSLTEHIVTLDNITTPTIDRFNAGDSIIVTENKSRIKLIIDSVSVKDTTYEYERDNGESYPKRETEWYKNHVITQYLWSTISPEHLQTIADVKTFSVELGGKQSITKARDNKLKYLQDYCRKLRLKIGR
jgi:hypothetical protein